MTDARTLTRADMRAALEHAEKALEHVAQALDRLTDVDEAGDHDKALTDLVMALGDIDGRLFDWSERAIRLRQALASTAL